LKGRSRATLAQVWSRLRGGSLEPGRAAASVAIGIFVGCLPIYGVQILVVLAVCVPLRLDAALAYVAAHVSNPFTLPFVLALEMETGSLLLTGHHATFDLEAAKRLGVAAVGAQIVCGAVVLGVVLGSVGALVTWVFVQSVRDLADREFSLARSRTLARYVGAPPSARWYLRAKLRTDPALRSIVALPGEFGRLLDAGCGYGQIALALLELGRARQVTGFDADAGRVAVAKSAADAAARFDIASLSELEFPEADTILFVDSLHYLPVEEQDRILARAAASLTVGGRIVVREVDAGSSLRSTVTEAAERMSAILRGHAVDFGFRSTTDLVAALGRAGLVPDGAQSERTDWSVTNNVLTIAAKPAPEPTGSTPVTGAEP